MRHVLVVANRTLGGDDLLAAVRERIAGGPVDFYLVVPAAGGSDRAPVLAAPGGGSALPLPGPQPSEGTSGYELAERRLEHGINRIRQAGGSVDGEVGEEDPLRAVESVLARREVDEVIVSTLPTGVSHWLRADLPARVHRKHHLPVTTVTMRVPSLR